MENNKKDIKSKYKKIYSQVETPDELKEKIIVLPHTRKNRLSALSRIMLIVAAFLAAFILSNLVAWAATGHPWIITVSDGMYDREYNKYKDTHLAPDEDVLESRQKESHEKGIAQVPDQLPSDEEDLYDRLGIETYSPEEAASIENYDPEDIVIKGDLTDEQLDALWEVNEQRFQERQREQCENAIKCGYVYLFENILETDESTGLPIHGYRYIKAFTLEELEGAVINDDLTWINIQGEPYYVMISHVGDFRELDSELPDLDRETCILRVFTEENYREKAEIDTVEMVEYFKNNLAALIYDGKVAAYSNEDASLIRTFTEEECHAAEISENFQAVRIAGEYYMVTYQLSDDVPPAPESIRLFPPEGYRGDARTEGLEDMHYYSMADFNLN